jgi:hypothetical protein
MDAASTLQIPRSVIAAADNGENTMVIARGQINQVYQQTQHPQTRQHRPVEPPYPEYPDSEEPQATRPVDGLVPTMQQPSPQRSLLSRRLDGN